MEQPMAKKTKMRLIWTGVIIVPLLAPILYFVHLELDLGSLIRTLPSDEKMIANFREHREDFEKLVKIYRYDSSVPFDRLCLNPTPDVEVIMKRAHVTGLCTDGYMWIPPDPYSEEARMRSIKRYAFGGPRDISGIFFSYDHGPVRIGTGKFDHVRKSYYYTPMIPRIEKGRQYPAYELLLTPVHRYRLFTSLNTYSDLLPAECYFRQIEPQWFIELCR